MTAGRFKKDQVREIFALAADREQARIAASEVEGLTLSDLLHVAEETGIDPSLVETAAQEIAARDGLEGQTDHDVDLRQVRFLPELPSAAAWDQVIRELRSRYGVDGAARDVGTAVEWSSGTGIGSVPPIRLRIEPEGTRARVVLEERLAGYRRIPDLIGSGLGLFGVLYAGAGPLMGQPEAGLVTGLGLLTAGLLGSVGGRKVFQRWRSRQEERLAALADRISLLSREENETSADAQPRPAHPVGSEPRSQQYLPDGRPDEPS